MSVTLTIHAGYPVRIGEELRAVLRVLKIRTGAWTISVVRDGEMAALHKRTMGLDSTTDVLTFDLREDDGGGKTQNAKRKTQNGKRRAEGGGILDLDTVICIDEARRRAGELGHSIRHEVLLYAIHSLLHVQGYDDLTAAEAARMHAKEDELLTKIGVGAVYGPPAGAGKRKTQSAKRKTTRVKRKGRRRVAA